jgi:hypothetical protein
MIQELENAAHNDLKLLHGVLEKMDKEPIRYFRQDTSWFIDDVFRRCQ